MTPLLDTHVVLWWQAGGDRLSREAKRFVDAATALLVSPLSWWEVSTLERLGRLNLDRSATSWVRDLLQDRRVATAQLSPEAAVWAGSLGAEFPGDPIDRLLYATARDLRVPLISKDEGLHGYARGRGEVDVLW